MSDAMHRDASAFAPARHPVEAKQSRDMANRRAPYFDPDTQVSSTLFSDVGRTPERPFMILATIAETSLGDLLAKVCFASTVKDRFDHARLLIRFRDDRPYSGEAVSLSPNADHIEGITDRRPAWLQRIRPDTRLWEPLSGAIKSRGRKDEAFFDLVLCDWMMNARTVHALGATTPLRIPSQPALELERQLLDLGLDRKRPFAVVHYRSNSYRHKKSGASGTLRDSDPQTFEAVIDYIIDALDCQVVQLGHPEMPLFSARPGFVDLSRLPSSFMMQAYAVSRARFMVGGPSGPLALGWGFDIPTALVDAVDGHQGFGAGEQLILTHEVTTPAGEVLSNKALQDAGLLDTRTLVSEMARDPGYNIRKNSVAEITAVCDHLHAKTSATEDWRQPREYAPSTPRPNSLTWPPQTNDELPFFDV